MRRTLGELLESLDDTYERVLREIKGPNRDHALHLLQCLVVATRPLRVKELAEVLAVDFDVADGIPKLKTTWRWEDQEQALLSSCSSLIAIVNDDTSCDSSDDDARVVQFSHFSVKEFLTSPRLATPSRDVSHYHIVLEHAHTIMAQACLSILLRSDDSLDQKSFVKSFKIRKSSVVKASPLGGYAAQYWVTHAQFESVSLRLRKAMEYLFDLDRPYFASWLRLYDIDTNRSNSVVYRFTPYDKCDATPLYYAALCGFQDLVEHLTVKHPQHVNASGGFYMTPAVAALAGKHFELARLLRRRGSSVDPRGSCLWSPLHSAACDGDLEVVQILVELKADINAPSESGQTPLHVTSCTDVDEANGVKVVRFLLEHGADATARSSGGFTSLHRASKYGRHKIVRVLLEHGLDIEATNDQDETPLQMASAGQHEETVKVLLEYGAK